MTAGAADVTGCILAGGRGRRLGGAVKPLLVVDGERIVDRQRRVLAPRVAELLLAIAAPGGGPLAELGLATAVDRFAEAGPLAGVDAALAARDRPWLLVVAGDMPDLRGELLDVLLAARSPAVDAVVPRVGGYPEPLLALYARTAAPAIERALAGGRRKTQAILDELRVAWLDEPALRAADPELASFRNVNHLHQLG
ncbi:MAG TPA: molybdenum cofactor guanylyltransferase [Kofleriaceae bacterium]|nr:molybdenum cofactor guanylyltransferase [Kofleriaceae bacterium]